MANFNLSPFRNSAEQDAYRAKREATQTSFDPSCAMCERPNKQKIDRGLLEIIEKDFTLFANDFPYEHYDNFKVKEHDLLVPKEHVSDLRNLSKEARGAFGDALIYIDALNLYTTTVKRTSQSAGSSIPEHGHQHLFVLDQTAKVTQHVYCEECAIVDTRFKGDPHISHN